MRRCNSDISLFLVEGGREHHAADPPMPRARARGAAAGARAGGAQEGAKDPVVGAPGTAGRGIPAA
jgi:hypothetical protein